jgi:polysaccharide deacetylase family protein (PEP-CTERM system associated)
MAINRNIMTVDLEDNYCDLEFSSWHKYDTRVVKTTRTILDLFEKYDVCATFFTLGYIAQKHPDLVEEVKSKGHEIASHGYLHRDLRKLSRDGFESDLTKSLQILRKISGDKVIGFRAPYFSVNKDNFWVFDVMKKHLQYDSSIFPVKPHYGLPDAPRTIYRISDKNPLEEDPAGNFIEIPMATWRLPLIGNIPIAGGFHMRFMPYQLLKLGISKLNKLGFPAVCYVHPEDLDPKRPKIEGYSWHYYWGLKGALKKFEALLKTFRFSSVREVGLS